MSRRLISLNEDLSKLEGEGYDIEVTSTNYLIIRDIPYVRTDRTIGRGILASTLTTAGNTTHKPVDDHVMFFIGDDPCDHRGAVLDKVIVDRPRTVITDNLVSNIRFSRKPPNNGKYPDYYEKIVAYVSILEGLAKVIDASVTAKTFPVKRLSVEESIFKYPDTATSRAGIVSAASKLEMNRIGIVGLGGNGSYLLDLVVKTGVREIHLFDGDDFLTHNAFRAPGAPSAEQLEAKPKKVDYFAELYGNMRYGIVPHPYYLDENTVSELAIMDFVFLCIDAGDSRRLIVEKLEEFNRPFIDVGVSVELIESSLIGTTRVTTSSEGHRDHLRRRVPLSDPTLDDIYNSNIQVADLNALNAALAVVRWKRYLSFYADYGKEFNSRYCIETNSLIREDYETREEN